MSLAWQWTAPVLTSDLTQVNLMHHVHT